MAKKNPPSKPPLELVKAAAKKAIDKAKADPKAKPAKAKKPSKPLLTKFQKFRAWADQADGKAMSELANHVVEGGHLAGFCKKKGFAYSTVMDWINADAAGRAVMYAHAREDRSDSLAEELVTIAMQDCSVPIMGEDLEGKLVQVGSKVDPGRVQQLKLQSDNLKWVASKLKPRTYGDKLELGGTVGFTEASDADLVKRMAGLSPALAAAAAAQLGVPVPTAPGGAGAIH